MAIKTKKRKKISKAVRLGNSFAFFYPKNPGSKPWPVKVKSKNDPNKLVYRKPADFLNSSFGRIFRTKFGTRKRLKLRYPALSGPQIVRAALECGYGRKGMWNSRLMFSPIESKDLAAYLMKRLLMVVSCVKIGNNDAYVVQGFYSKIEPSEKVAISFIIGGMGSYVAAKHWLNAAGQHISKMLHTSIYTTAAIPGVKTNPTGTEKSPDYLILSSSNEWHVFESKGGTHSGRYKRIQEGLLQLGHITSVGWSGKPQTPVVTNVCTHVSIDGGKKLEVLAYDPPGEMEMQKAVTLDKAVCYLLTITESLDQFNAVNNEPEASGHWTFKELHTGSGLRIAIPKKYLLLENQMRIKLGLFMLVSESLTIYSDRRVWQADSLTKIVERLLRLKISMPQSESIIPDFINFIEQLSNVDSPDYFIELCREKLDIDAEFIGFENALIEAKRGLGISVNDSLDDAPDMTFTSGGMLITEYD
ncbi:hypothetical protein [Pantoea piersonii]|uniref:hypothetical protein n=1 Tax=Pantoea piersonii TaxID=2364647 RepID=UPI00289D47B5|nr:hypothetical protein [Pantoea piersonii]